MKHEMPRFSELGRLSDGSSSLLGALLGEKVKRNRGYTARRLFPLTGIMNNDW